MTKSSIYVALRPVAAQGLRRPAADCLLFRRDNASGGLDGGGAGGSATLADRGGFAPEALR